MRCRKLKHLARSSLYGTFASDDYIARRKEKNDTPTIQSRPICARCNRPTQVCVCLAMPFKALATSTRFVILQHPAEAKRRVTGTVPLIRLCLSNCRVVVMGDQAPGEGAMKEILGLQEKQEGEIGSVPLLLFPLDGAELLEDIAVTEGIATSPLLSDLGSKDAYKSEQHLTATPLQNWEGLNIVVSHNGSPEEEDGGGKVEVDVNKFGGRGVVAPSLETVPLRGPVAQVESQAVRSVPARTVVLVDGTWSQARGILHANPFLIPFTARTKIGGRGRSGGKKTCKQSTQSGEKGGGVEGRGGGGGGGKAGLCRVVAFADAGSSGYSFRREPRRECLSTLESVAYVLEVLEPTPEGLKTALHLREVFSMMVSHQLQRTGIPRFVDRKAKTLNRKATPPRGQ